MRDEQTKRSLLQVASFIHFGAVWNHSNNPTPLLFQNFLAAGLGVIIEPIERLIFRIDMATSVIG